eukprot:tig00020995_g16910.t1
MVLTKAGDPCAHRTFRFALRLPEGAGFTFKNGQAQSIHETSAKTDEDGEAEVDGWALYRHGPGALDDEVTLEVTALSDADGSSNSIGRPLSVALTIVPGPPKKLAFMKPDSQGISNEHCRLEVKNGELVRVALVLLDEYDAVTRFNGTAKVTMTVDSDGSNLRWRAVGPGTAQFHHGKADFAGYKLDCSVSHRLSHVAANGVRVRVDLDGAGLEDLSAEFVMAVKPSTTVFGEAHLVDDACDPPVKHDKKIGPVIEASAGDPLALRVRLFSEALCTPAPGEKLDQKPFVLPEGASLLLTATPAPRGQPAVLSRRVSMESVPGSPSASGGEGAGGGIAYAFQGAAAPKVAGTYYLYVAPEAGRQGEEAAIGERGEGWKVATLHVSPGPPVGVELAETQHLALESRQPVPTLHASVVDAHGNRARQALDVMMTIALEGDPGGLVLCADGRVYEGPEGPAVFEGFPLKHNAPSSTQYRLRFTVSGDNVPEFTVDKQRVSFVSEADRAKCLQLGEDIAALRREEEAAASALDQAEKSKAEWEGKLKDARAGKAALIKRGPGSLGEEWPAAAGANGPSGDWAETKLKELQARLFFKLKDSIFEDPEGRPASVFSAPAVRAREAHKKHPIPGLVGIAADLAAAEGLLESQAIARFIGRKRMEAAIFATQEHVRAVENSRRFKGLAAFPIASTDGRLFYGAGRPVSGPERHLADPVEFEPIPERYRGRYMVNALHPRAPEGRELRGTYWYRVLKDSVLFESEEDMDRYLREHLKGTISRALAAMQVEERAGERVLVGLRVIPRGDVQTLGGDPISPGENFPCFAVLPGRRRPAHARLAARVDFLASLVDKQKSAAEAERELQGAAAAYTAAASGLANLKRALDAKEAEFARLSERIAPAPPPAAGPSGAGGAHGEDAAMVEAPGGGDAGDLEEEEAGARASNSSSRRKEAPATSKGRGAAKSAPSGKRAGDGAPGGSGSQPKERPAKRPKKANR